MVLVVEMALDSGEKESVELVAAACVVSFPLPRRQSERGGGGGSPRRSRFGRRRSIRWIQESARQLRVVAQDRIHRGPLQPRRYRAPLSHRRGRRRAVRSLCRVDRDRVRTGIPDQATTVARIASLLLNIIAIGIAGGFSHALVGVTRKDIHPPCGTT